MAAMQMFRTLELDQAARVGWGVRVLLASPTGLTGRLAMRLAGLGGLVEVEPQLFDALSFLTEDPRGAQMLVIDCDAYGGVEAGRRAIALLAGQVPGLQVVLVAANCPEQVFPTDRALPIMLRAPVSAVALRVAFETAFQGRRVPGSA